MIPPAEGYPISAEATREWSQRTNGREASEEELGDLLEALARRDSDRAEAGLGPSRE